MCSCNHNNNNVSFLPELPLTETSAFIWFTGRAGIIVMASKTGVDSRFAFSCSVSVCHVIRRVLMWSQVDLLLQHGGKTNALRLVFLSAHRARLLSDRLSHSDWLLQTRWSRRSSRLNVKTMHFIFSTYYDKKCASCRIFNSETR